MQWSSQAKYPQGPIVKVPPFPPHKFAYKDFEWNKIIFVPCKDIRIIKTSSISPSKNHKLVTVFFSSFLSLTSLAFSACRLCHQNFSYFILLPFHVRIWTRHISSNFLPCWLSVSSETHNLASTVYSFQGIEQKN